MIDYDTIAEFEAPPAPGTLGVTPAMGFAGQAPALIDQDPATIRRGVIAGAMTALPSLDIFRRPKFSDEPDFNPYAAAIERGNAGDIDALMTTRSRAEFDWVSNRLDEDRNRYSRDMQLSPGGAVGGALLAGTFYPSNYIPFTAPARLAGVASTIAKLVATSVAEETLVTLGSSERTLDEALLNVAIGTATASIVGTALYSGNKVLRGLRKPPEQLVDDFVRADAAAGAARGENSAIDPFEVRQEARSVGAFGVATIPSQAQRVWANGMADALGAEHVPDIVVPLTRIMHSRDVPEVSELGEMLMEVPYELNKNRGGDRTETNNVENILRRTWRPMHAEWRQSLDVEYLEHLKEIGERPRLGTVLVSDLEQRITGRSHDFASFRQLVWQDMARGSVDGPGWAPSAAVRRASQRTRAMYDRLIDDAMELDLHVKDLRAQLARTQDPAEIKRLHDDIDARTQGIIDNKHRFVNVIFDKEKIRAEPQRFINFVMMKKRISQAEAERAVEKVLMQTPFHHLDQSNRVGTPRSLHSRELVDDPLLWSEWLDTDVLNGGTLYMRTMSPDIELARAFGMPDMGEQLADVRKAFDNRIAAAPSAKERARLERARDDRIEDLEAVRDLLRGTYMIPPDPEHPISRSIRIAKNWNVATMLTGAIAAVPDVARVVTANGLAKSFGSLFDALRNPKLYGMAKSEARAVGEAWDIVLGTRAAVFADIGEAVGAFSRAERIAAEVGQQTFNINLMNFWNETMKSASSLVVSTKILGDVEALVAGKATTKQTARLAASGIDLETARKIAGQSGRWYRTDHNIIAQTSTWTDDVAADAFRAALSRELNIVVLTPGIGERPLWMSKTLDKTLGVGKTPTVAQLQEIGRMRANNATNAQIAAYVQAQGIGRAPSWLSQPYLSLVAQFKSFIMSSTYRTLIPALQQRDGDVLAMLAVATAMGLAIEHIRAKQGGYSPPTNTFDAILSGIDRAGVLGWYLEPNNVIERMSGNRIGLRPAFGDARQYGPNARTVAGAFFGPTGSQAANVATIVTDVLGGEFDQHTAKAIRRVVPWQSVAHMDWAFDQLELGIRGAGYRVRDVFEPEPEPAPVQPQPSSALSQQQR